MRIKVNHSLSSLHTLVKLIICLNNLKDAAVDYL